MAAVDEADAARALEISHARLRAGDEVVHLGCGIDVPALARVVVAEDARRVVWVGADDAAAASLVDALSELGAEDVEVEVARAVSGPLTQAARESSAPD